MKISARENRGNFIKPFTFQRGYVSGCDFQIDLAEGCKYNCAYCFLNHYLGHSELRNYTNIDNLTEELDNSDADFFNCSVLTDGSILADKTEMMTSFFKVADKFPKKSFEIRFKHSSVIKLLKLNPPKNIIFSATLTGRSINSYLEGGTSALKERIEILERFGNHGYSIGGVMDPVIIYEGWEDEYRELAALLKKTGPLAFLGIGLLRLENTIYNSFLERVIQSPLKGKLKGEMVRTQDNKFRYFFPLREKVYRKIIGIMNEVEKKRTILYMEREDVGKKLLS